MATDINKGDTNDWTAGIIAIGAALVLGAAAPIGIYFGLYMPQTKQLEMWTLNAQANEIKLHAEQEKEGRMQKMQGESDRVRGEIEKVEARFSAADENLIHQIEGIAQRHKVELPQDKRNFKDVMLVKNMESPTFMPQKLRAEKIYIECSATYNDFGRFMAELENLPNATLIPGNFVAAGNSGAGKTHTFRVEFFVVQKRDLGSIGINVPK
ncbi:MAG: hypothetical protein IT462_02555 [Planctomycetes bacterium]|nr:hypothetical protein [Planctomycetota bacterium]